MTTTPAAEQAGLWRGAFGRAYTDRNTFDLDGLEAFYRRQWGVSRTEMNARVIGIEPSPALAAACREKGIEVIESRFETVVLPEVADVIAAFEVVEHLFRPKELLDFAIAWLKPGGLLILTCPNIEGFETLALGRASPAVDHQHLNYFTPRSLALLAGRVGFGDVEVTELGRLDVDLLRRALAAGTVRREQLGGFVAHLIDAGSDAIDERFQAFLQAAGLSSNMMMVARKPAAGA